MPLLTPEERLGTLVGGKFRLVEILGRGGMGVVYRSDHALLGRPVAVKLLAPQLTTDENLVRRFLREGRASAALRHPNVVDVIDMGADDAQTVYIVMELLQGRSLRDELEARKVLPPEEAIQHLRPICDALAFAHAQGVIHRDIKPDNIFLANDATGSTTPKLLDFGIAKVLREAQAKSQQTSSGQFMGTLYYTSPEQLRDSATVTHKTDLWAMGIVLYECMSGVPPFNGVSTLEVLRAACHDEPTRFDGCPNELWQVLQACLEKNPDKRIASAEVLGARLSQARAAIEASAFRHPSTRSLWPYAVALGVGLVAAAAWALTVQDGDALERQAGAPTSGAARPEARPTEPAAPDPPSVLAPVTVAPVAPVAPAPMAADAAPQDADAGELAATEEARPRARGRKRRATQRSAPPSAAASDDPTRIDNETRF